MINTATFVLIKVNVNLILKEIKATNLTVYPN